MVVVVVVVTLLVAAAAAAYSGSCSQSHVSTPFLLFIHTTDYLSSHLSTEKSQQLTTSYWQCLGAQCWHRCPAAGERPHQSPAWQHSTEPSSCPEIIKHRSIQHTGHTWSKMIYISNIGCLTDQQVWFPVDFQETFWPKLSTLCSFFEAVS